MRICKVVDVQKCTCAGLLNNAVIKEEFARRYEQSGAPDRIRTCNPRFRRPVPYPVWPLVRGGAHYLEESLEAQHISCRLAETVSNMLK